ncbi:hypothetical protein ACF3MZ_31585 [Paenibacillaceae bacterium WGS1546]|uniref:hypothetical protein n=1 Tax=Cohnella sp. WGS1546 TaxID=3366810 RepID=UPI00372D8014
MSQAKDTEKWAGSLGSAAYLAFNRHIIWRAAHLFNGISLTRVDPAPAKLKLDGTYVYRGFSGAGRIRFRAIRSR